MRQSSSSWLLGAAGKLCLAAVAAVGVMLTMAAFSGQVLSQPLTAPGSNSGSLSASHPATETNRILGPQFDASDRKVGPAYAYTGDTITYTVYTKNTGPLLYGVALRDELPPGTTFIPASCTYVVNTNPPQPCGPLTQLWLLDLDTGDHVTTTYSVSIWGGTMSWPLVNCAYLSWGSSELQMCASTVLNPWFVSINYLPILFREFTAPVPYLILTADPLALVTGNTAVLTATAYNAQGNPIPNLPVTFSTIDPLGSGALVPLGAQTNASGQVVATLRSTLDGPVRVVAQASNGSSDSIFVNFHPDPVSACVPHLVALLETGPSPREVALDVAGRRAFVAHLEGVTVLDMDTFQSITEINSVNDAHGIAYDPTRDRIWVTHNSDRVLVLDGSTYGTLNNLPAGGGPFSIEYNPTNGRVYVTNWSGNTVGAYVASNPASWSQLGVFVEPAYMAVNPDTNKVYVANHRPSGHVRAIDGSSHDVSFIFTALIDPYGAAADTTRNLIYASSIQQGRICVIDGATDTQIGCMDVRHTSDGSTVPLRVIQVNPEFDHLFAVTSSADGEPSRFLLIPAGSTAPITPTTPVPMYLRNYPMDGIALDPVDDRVWVTNVASGLVSVVQDGPIVCSTPFPRGFGAEYELRTTSRIIPRGFVP